MPPPGGDGSGGDGSGGPKPGGDTPGGGGQPPGGDGQPPGGDNTDPTLQIPMTFFRGRGGAEALEKAVTEAFKGVDWKEFEEAWKKATLRVH